MDYSVRCDCGRRITVAASAAGASVECVCRKEVSVPPLSELRRTAGQGAYEAGIVDTIHRMLQSGELPYGGTCAWSGRPTQDTVQLHVQCERSWTRSTGNSHSAWNVLFAMQAPIGALIAWWLTEPEAGEENETVGHDRFASTPLRMCAEFHRKLHARTSQRRLRKLLRTVPIYAKLLDEYPSSKVFVGRP